MRGNYLSDLKETMKKWAGEVGTEGIYESFVECKNQLENMTETSLYYHNKLMDANSIRENLFGTRLIQKGSMTVVKSDSGSLVETIKPLSEEEIGQVADRIGDLKDYVEENGAHFLYLAAPRKELVESMPDNAENYARQNQKAFLRALDRRDIPYLSLLDALQEKKIPNRKLFFYTDHHWTPYAGFEATDSICMELDKRYGFPIEEKYTDIDNYNRKTYHDWFLGSKGKKTGTYFSWKGADDFELITPKFSTRYKEEQPAKKEKRKGSFEETALFKKNLKKDYYGVNTYATYSGGDYRLQILKNLDRPKGKKIFLIRDSYGCVISPFLSLQCSSLYVSDIRNFDYFVGDPIDVRSFVKEKKPDYVLVMYSGIVNMEHSDGKFDFFR